MGSAQNTLRVFEAVAQAQPAGLRELARRAGLPTTTAHRAVTTLAGAGWIGPAPGPGRRWIVTGRVRRLVATADATLVGVAGPVLEQLRDQSGESVSLAVPDGSEMVIVAHLDGTAALRVVDVEGTRAPMHAAATGKALLALLPDAERVAFLGRTLSTYTASTITDPADLEAELAAVRARGWAHMNAEWDPGVASVGAAILDETGRPVAGVGVSGPVQRFDAVAIATLAGLVTRAAAEISTRLPGTVPQELGQP